MNNTEYDIIQKHLRDNESDYSSIWIDNNGIVSILVEWGDWKHSHAYLDYIMKQIGYTLFDVQITEEDGSDCYSSVHLYRK